MNDAPYGVPLTETHFRVTLGEVDYTPADVIVMLTLVGERLCAYGGGEWRTRRCDCKFLRSGVPSRGEETGCAELRTAIDLIERLSGTLGARTNTTLRAKLRRVTALSRKQAAELQKVASLYE